MFLDHLTSLHVFCKSEISKERNGEIIHDKCMLYSHMYAVE